MTGQRCGYDTDCPDLAWRGGLCRYHYNRRAYLKKIGKTEDETNSWRHGQTIKERILANIIIDIWGCWIWQQSTRNGGYGEMWSSEYTDRNVHHLAYMEWIGPIPDGMIVDHECHNEAARQGRCVDTDDECTHRRCCNPEHLVLRTQGDNVLSSPLTQASINKAKTECKRGHPFDEENTRLKKRGGRSCKTCEKMTPEERRAFDANMQVNGVDSDDT